MKYSLRSLMIVVTLTAVVLGAWAGRVDYLRRWSAYHSIEYRRLTKSLAAEFKVSEKRVEELCEILDNSPDPSTFGLPRAGDNAYRTPHPCQPAIKHKRLARVYQQASFKPWALVDEDFP